MKRLAMWLMYLCYRLEHHYLLQISLRNWLWFLVVVPPLLVVFRRIAWLNAAILSALGGLILLGTEWARRKEYLIFEPARLPGSHQARAPIEADEQVLGWASGPFAVGGKQKYLANEAVRLSYVRSREHILMACLQRTRFLLFARSLNSDVGWWYAFFEPQDVQRVEMGYIWCGLRARPGLVLSYRNPDEGRDEATVYLAFPDADTVQRVMADLRIDVPPLARQTT
jgi:hypothetical protein